MTVKYGKYFNFSCQQGGISPPPVVLSEGVRTPPGGNPGLYRIQNVRKSAIIYLDWPDIW